MIQYDLLYGDMYTFDGANPFLQEDMTYGVKDVSISRILRTETRTILYGQKFTQFSHVFLNGEEVKSELIGPSSMSIEEEIKDGDKIHISQMTAKGKNLLNSRTYRYSDYSGLEAID